MILQALVKHYEALADQGKVSREGWCRAKVSYAVNLSKEGTIISIISMKQEEERGKKKVMIPALVTVPEMVTRTVRVSSNFLCDNAKYILGIDKEGADSRSKECFQAARERHLSLLRETKGEMASAIRLYFETWDPEKAMECIPVKENWEELTEGGNLVFYYAGEFAQEDSQIKGSWDGRGNGETEGAEGICLVTGTYGEISRIHKLIKGVPGAQSSGAALVSFNAPAFESYGKAQSYNAPVGRYAEFAYTTALNYLISHREYTFQLGDSLVLFWAESGEEAYQQAFFFSMDTKPDNEEELKAVFKNLKEHKAIRVQGVELNPDQKFYILCLAPNAARLSVRFFYENSFGMILKNISRHYERMKTVRPAWEKAEYMGIWRMLQETVNQKSKDKLPISNMAAMVLKAVLADGRYPASLYTDTMIRVRAEQGSVTWGRAGIIKAYLIQNYKWEKGDQYMGLNQESIDTAYVLGRLFSVLESIQLEANPGIKATIRDRYFNSACTTPASVFPILIKLENSHIKKLDRDKAGLKIYYDQLLGEIMDRLDQFPRRLTLEEQGRFDLGYYHQTQKKYEKKEEK